MVKFAHLGDCHLGSWRQPELQELNFINFKKAIDISIEEKVDFILIAGDLFDSAYPPVEILKETFAEFRKLKENSIRVFMIAGSHDYSVSGKTFLDVLEKAGFCEICKYKDEKDENGEIQKIILLPLNYQGIEIYGYPGKKSSLEIKDLKKISFPDTNNIRILMLHTSLTEAIGTLPIESISLQELPKAEYYALAHLHINFSQKTEKGYAIYSGPIFPNSFQEMEDIGEGSFYIIELQGYMEAKKISLKAKDSINFKIELKDALSGTDYILRELDKKDLENKIVLLRLEGILEKGTNADINYEKIKKYLEERKAYSFLKNTSKLSTKQDEESASIEISSGDMEEIELKIIKEYEEKNPDKFNSLIKPLTNALSLSKQEDEKTGIYEQRLLSEINKILNLNLQP